MIQNPWLGLATYDEQAVAQGYKFCGRECAINELYSIIDNNLLTTLYGKSGIGKSSLLQAGVFPRLRAENYLPVMIRLGIESTATYSFSTLIVEALRNAIQKINGQCICSQENDTPREEERLWQFFHTTEFRDGNGDALFPVIVLDQFEELYYKDKQQLKTLLKSLYLLVDDSSLPMSNDNDAANYRIVLSIREDDLFHLEDSIDKLRLTEMKYNRYRLHELTADEARNVILQPEVNLFNPTEADAIADCIIRKAGSEEISTAVLSLICSRIYYMQQSILSVDNTSHHITLSQIKTFFNQAEGNFLKSFYDDIIKELKSRDKWHYIEDKLVTDEGRRNSVLKSEFDKAVPNSEFLFRGDKSMLRCITTVGTDEPRVEIIHDMLARQMMSSRNERKLQEQTRALRKQRIIAVVIILLTIILGAVFYTQYRSIVAERNSMLKMQSHYIAEKAEKLIEEGKLFHAMRLLLAVLPEDLNKPNRPYVTAAELALRKANNNNSFPIFRCKHEGIVYSAQFSPNGNYIVTASGDQTAKIWDAKTGKQMGETMKHEGIVYSVQFSPDGNRIVTASSEGTVKIWDAETGKQIGETMEHEDFVNSVQFSPDGNYIVTASGDQTAKIWDAKTGKQMGETMKHEGIVYSVQFSPDGNYIVTASRDSTVKIWDAKTGKQMGEIIKHEGIVYSVQVSSDGNRIVTASSDNTVKIWYAYGWTWENTVRIWGATKWKQMSETMEHEDFVNSVQFSPDGNYIVTASRDGIVKIWDVMGKQVGETIKHEGYVNSAQFSPDGNYIVTASMDSTVKIWDAKTGKQMGETIKHEGYVNSAQFSPDGNYIVTASSDNTAKIWATNTGKQKGETIEHEGIVYSVQFSPDGNYIVTESAYKTAKIWDANTGIQVEEIMEHERWVNSVQFSPDGNYIVTASRDSTVKIWDVKMGKQVGETIKHEGYVNSVQFSPDGNYIVTISQFWATIVTAQIWDAKTGKQVGETIKHESSLCSVPFSPDGNRIVTASRDNTVKIWDIKTGKQVGKTMKHEGTVYSVQFSPDGNYIVTKSAYKTAKIWDANTGIQVEEIMEHERWVNSVQFSPDGNYIVTVSDDKTAKIWDVKMGKQVGETMKHEGSVNSAQFSPNGNYIVTASDDQTAKIWDAKTGKQVGETMKYEGSVFSAQFSPTGNYIVTVLDDKTVRITEYPPLQKLIDKYRKIYQYWPLTEEELIEYNFK